MKRTTVAIPQELEKALEAYLRDLEIPPSPAALMQAALTEYLRQRGYSVRDDALGSRPSMCGDAPAVKGTKTAAEMVLEDRR